MLLSSLMAFHFIAQALPSTPRPVWYEIAGRLIIRDGSHMALDMATLALSRAPRPVWYEITGRLVGTRRIAYDGNTSALACAKLTRLVRDRWW
jgi:hypothetical protein